MDIFDIFTLLGGIGLFLYGISLLGSSLEKLAGSGLEKILERLTTSKKKGVGAVKGFGLGVGVTGIIQSSAATSVMLIGFVNAGIMTLMQAIPVVFGANVGSTVTAQILRLGDLGEDNMFLKMLKPESFAPIIVVIGAFILLLSNKKRMKDIANIFMGFGILFIGMNTMEDVFAPLKESQAFQDAFTSFANPLFGVLVGLVITAIIQSSSASVGILQAISATGSVTYSTAIPIIIGQNIGKCMTIILGSIGTNKKAKRVSLSYLLFNIFGAVFFLILIYGINALHPFNFWSETLNRGDIANIHLGFNLITSLILLPLTSQVAKLTGKIIHDNEEEDRMFRELSTLDPMLLKTPAIAIDQCYKVMNTMCDAITENYDISTNLIYSYDEKLLSKLDENESFIDKCESSLSEYLLQITSRRLTKNDRKRATELLNCISDFERMGDHCINISYVAQSKREQNIHFSPKGRLEVDSITNAVKATMQTTFNAFKNDDAAAAYRVEPLEETIDLMKETIKSHHIQRLQTGDCGIQGGIALVDLVTSYERISSHCANVALHIAKMLSNDEDFDEMHGHITDKQSRNAEEYKALLHYYYGQYMEPIINPKLENIDTDSLLETASATEAVSEAVPEETKVLAPKSQKKNDAGQTDSEHRKKPAHTKESTKENTKDTPSGKKGSPSKKKEQNISGKNSLSGKKDRHNQDKQDTAKKKESSSKPGKQDKDSSHNSKKKRK